MSTVQSSMASAAMGKFQDVEVLKQIDKIRTFASAKRPALASDRAAWAMAWLHMVIWDSWKSAYYYADHHASADFTSYRDYALLSLTFLVDHHNAEESVLFPEIEVKIPGSMVTNHAQHQSFLADLGDLVNYVSATKPENGSAPFDAAVFKQKIDALLLPVMTHLADELDSLDGAKLRAHFTEAEAAALNARSHAAQKGDSHLMLPFVLQSLPHGSPFPPAPGFVKTLLGPWVFYWKYRALWKYTAYPF